MNSVPPPIARIQQNLLARSERRLLTWLCARLPMWVTPDLLTATGVGGAAVILAGYSLSNFHAGWLWLAILGYAIQWFGDSLDGSLARFRKIERPQFGYFIDHSCDGLVTLMIVVGIGISPYVRLDAALFALSGYLLLAIHAFLSVKVIGEMRLSYLNAGPTELRLVLIALTVAMMSFGPGEHAWVGGFGGFDLLFVASGLIMVGLFIVQTTVVARRLDRLDRLG